MSFTISKKNDEINTTLNLNVTNYYKQNDSILEHQEYKTVHTLLKVKKKREPQNYMKIIEKNIFEFISGNFSKIGQRMTSV